MKVLIKNLAIFFLSQPAVSAGIFTIQLCRHPRKGCPSTLQHMISCTLQPLYKRVLIYLAFLWSGYERIVVYFAPNIQRLGLILIVFFRSGKIVGSKYTCLFLLNKSAYYAIFESWYIETLKTPQTIKPK